MCWFNVWIRTSFATPPKLSSNMFAAFNQLSAPEMRFINSVIFTFDCVICLDVSVSLVSQISPSASELRSNYSRMLCCASVHVFVSYSLNACSYTPHDQSPHTLKLFIYLYIFCLFRIVANNNNNNAMSMVVRDFFSRIFIERECIALKRSFTMQRIGLRKYNYNSILMLD